MPTTYGNDIVYCLKSHCGVRGYCRQKWVLQVQIICKFSNERTCKRNKDVQGLSCGFEVINKMEQEIVKQTYVNSPGQKAPYRRPSIKIIEVEVQQLITASDVQSVQSTNWQPETDEGEITDGSGN